MRGRMAVALFAIIFGAVETAGAAQELIYRGTLNSETEPMIIGALGMVAGVLSLAAGIAFLIGSRLTSILVPAAACVSVPVFLLSGVFMHYAGWPVTLVGIIYPVFLFFFSQKNDQAAESLSRT
jgi:hypothetical protein